MFRKTKIICTIGPAVKDEKILEKLIIAGMNVARFNFSHGDHTYHKESIEMVKHASDKCSIPVALMIDTKGPEIRTGIVKNNKKIQLETNKKVILTTDDVECTNKVISISHKNLPYEIKKGKRIFIADGLVNLEVEEIVNNEIHCLIRNGAEIGSRKNVNVVGIKSSLPAITEKDVEDIAFGLEHNIDFIAASFIRKPSDVKEIKSIIESHDVKCDIIAKIEDQEGFDNIDEIIRVAKGVMVARGDLGVQLKAEEIPLVQKRIIRKCNEVNKPVITATQMLDSMINNPIPTRAETTDVANAILDGTDAIMLSGETASGKYPVKAVQMMHEIALEIENSREYKTSSKFVFERRARQTNIAEAISQAGFVTANNIGADVILTPTKRGNTPRLISKYRPNQIILAVTPFEEVKKNLLLYWGVYPIIANITDNSDKMIENAIQEGKKHNLIKNFNKVVIVAGIPVNSPIMLNHIKVHLECTILGKSSRGYGGTASGKAVIVEDYQDAVKKIKGSGDEILITDYIDEKFFDILKKLKGYVLEQFSSMSWQEIYKVNPDLTALAGMANATKNIKDNQIITIDGEEKLVYDGSRS